MLADINEHETSLCKLAAKLAHAPYLPQHVLPSTQRSNVESHRQRSFGLVVLSLFFFFD